VRRGGSVIRLVPPLSSTLQQIDDAAEILAAALAGSGRRRSSRPQRLDTKV